MQPSDRANQILGALQSYATHPEDQHIEVQGNSVKAVQGKNDPKILETVANLSRVIGETEFEVSFNFRELKRDLEVLRENQKGIFGESKEVREAFDALSDLVTSKAQDAINPQKMRNIRNISFDDLLQLIFENPQQIAIKIRNNQIDLSRFREQELRALSLPLMGKFKEVDVPFFINIFKIYSQEGQRDLFQHHLRQPDAAFLLNFHEFRALPTEEMAEALTAALKLKKTLTPEEFKKVMDDIKYLNIREPQLGQVVEELSRLNPIDTFLQNNLHLNLTAENRALVILNTAKALSAEKNARYNVTTLIEYLPTLDNLDKQTRKEIFDELFRLDPIIALTNFRLFFHIDQKDGSQQSQSRMGGDAFDLLEQYLIKLEDKSFDSYDAERLIHACLEFTHPSNQFIDNGFRFELAYRLMKFQPYETLRIIDKFIHPDDRNLVNNNYKPFLEAYRKALEAHPDEIEQIKRAANYVFPGGEKDVEAIRQGKDVVKSREQIHRSQQEAARANEAAEIAERNRKLEEARNYLLNNIDKFKAIPKSARTFKEQPAEEYYYEESLNKELSIIFEHFKYIRLNGNKEDLELARKKAPAILREIGPLLQDSQRLIQARKTLITGGNVVEAATAGTSFPDLSATLLEVKEELDKA